MPIACTAFNEAMDEQKERKTGKCAECGGSGETFRLPRGNPFSMRIETLSRAMVKVRCTRCRGTGNPKNDPAIAAR